MREKEKLNNVLSGVVEMSRLPGALFVIDVKKEAIAVKEARRLSIPVFAIVDTNCDPDGIDYVIPANDDAIKSVQVITKVIGDAVAEGKQRAAAHHAEVMAEHENKDKDKEKDAVADEKPAR
jgi:small subunit ribosomal protein S2